EVNDNALLGLLELEEPGSLGGCGTEGPLLPTLCFFPREGEGAAGRSSLRRIRSVSLASSGSMSPLWEGSGSTSSFGTLPRKSRRSSVRKQLLKFIPGLHRAVEEEESRV
ncbi:PREDICTED: cytohesin-interacting protein-like, partial [Merops nubicus]|uniref:cytohesin-interacting protein-like n=1 Tax=Merops nubicus TaxID=57421 RepID=UPI0004F03438